MRIYQTLIEENQASSLKRVLEEALEYHFNNFTKLEKLAEPYSFQDRMGIVDATTRMRANTNIKFEVQAYLIQYRRLKHFIRYLQNNGGFDEPTDPEVKKIWNDLMNDQGIINIFVNKWAAHRSADDPRKGDTDSLHLAVLLNLESTITLWDNGHLYLSIENHELYLSDYHPKALGLVNWIFATLEKRKN